MEGTFDFVLTELGDSLKENVLPVGFPSWYRRYNIVFRLYAVQEENIARKDWSNFISEKILHAEDRLIFNLDWPLMIADLRKDVLRSLQQALIKGIKVYSYFQAVSTVPANSSQIPISFNNIAGHIETVYSEKKQFLSFVIINNDLLFESPAQPYHNYRKFYFVSSLKEGVLKNIFSEYLEYF